MITRFCFVILVAAVLVAPLVGCSKEDSASKGTGEAVGNMAQALNPEEGRMAVTVNGRVVTEQEVVEEQGRMLQQLAGRVPPEQLETMQDAIRKQAQENMINRVLLEQAIATEGIEAPKEEVDARLSEIRSNFESAEDFSGRLSAMGITEDDLRQEIGSALRMERLVDIHTSGVEAPSAADLRSFYDENSEQFMQPEKIKASHILIQTGPEDGEPEKATKRLEAAKILGEIQKGADFAQMASQHSKCPSSANGGDLGFFGRGQMVKPFEDAAFALGVGEVSDIVETRFGYHIIKVTERQEPSTVPFETARDDIASFLEGQKKQEAMGAYTDELRASAAIEYPEPTPSRE